MKRANPAGVPEKDKGKRLVNALLSNFASLISSPIYGTTD